MESVCRRRDLRVLIITVILMVMMMRRVLGTLHRVGDKMGWSPNVNYTQWSSHENFYVGDWLIFNFDKNMYNVLEVNKTSYESCNEQGFIKNITHGGRDVYQLLDPRPYYFLSGRGFCWGGMKLAILVQQTSATPLPAPVTSRSPAKNSGSQMSLLLALVLSLIWGNIVVKW